MYALLFSTSSNEDSRTTVSLINAQSRHDSLSEPCCSLSDGDGGRAV